MPLGTTPTASGITPAQTVVTVEGPTTRAKSSKEETIATLTVLKFETPEGAEQALRQVQEWQRESLIQILDAAWITWPRGKKKPQTRQSTSMAGAGALGGAFWGFLFGLLFFIPFLGMAM